MEVDRIMYIFGSFTRKKDKRKSLDQTSISAGNSPLHVKSRPVSQNLAIPPRTSAYEDRGRGKSQVKEWDCKLCGKELVEPRLLGCLHSFCTRCLQGLPQEGEAEVWSEVDGGSIQLEAGDSLGSGVGSAGSGYESDLQHSGSDGSWEVKPKKYGILTRKVSGKHVQIVLCPICGHETPLPLGGISALPLNYVLLRKMAAMQDGVNVLCDLCSNDNKAESRCNQCLVSICSSCGEAHSRQKATARHSLQALDPLPVSFCSQHPRAELSVYCSSCHQVICRECCVISHGGHALCSAARAAAERCRVVRDARDRARSVPDHVARATSALHVHAYEIDCQAACVEAEIRTWAEQYRKAVEAHGRALCVAAARARERHRQRVEEMHRQLEDRAQHANEAVQFADELLTQGKEAEMLSLSGPVLRRLEELTDSPAGEVPKLELRFAARAPAAHDSTLVGRLLTQSPDPATCMLNTEVCVHTESKPQATPDHEYGACASHHPPQPYLRLESDPPPQEGAFDGFQDLRAECQHETLLELRDSSGERVWCGGEQVAGYFRRRDSSARPALANVKDRADGTYSIVFTPPTPGTYLLAVTLNNKPIKGSPFTCCARVGKSHTGQFHCCAFCSSGGKRDATCGCGATMPGGYKGCGHGHAGWPGTRHWSCCGATARHSDCTRAKPRSRLYQFSL